MKKKSNTLLLTACIHPKFPSHKESFYDIREKQYEDALKYYIYNSNFTHIVFIDNSNHVLNFIKKLQPNKKNYYIINNKTIEYISYNWNKLTEKFFYGYWEQEIMDYALDNSTILKKLQKNDSFFKITWRYIIKNINHLIDRKEQELFFRWLWWFSCVTAIFKITKWNFINYLYWKVRQFYIKFSQWHFITLETVYYIHLRNHIYNTVKVKYPIFIFRYLNDWSIRHALPIHNKFLVKFIYWFSFLVMLNQFWLFSRFLDVLFYNLWFKKHFKITS